MTEAIIAVEMPVVVIDQYMTEGIIAVEMPVVVIETISRSMST